MTEQTYSKQTEALVRLARGPSGRLSERLFEQWRETVGVLHGEYVRRRHYWACQRRCRLELAEAQRDKRAEAVTLLSSLLQDLNQAERQVNANIRHLHLSRADKESDLPASYRSRQLLYAQLLAVISNTESESVAREISVDKLYSLSSTLAQGANTPSEAR